LVPFAVSAASLAVAIGFLVGTGVSAQTPQAGGNTAPNFEAQSPIDLTGQWVSVVTEDWRWRMVTPPKGDFASIPLNAEGRRVGDAWDPDKDTAEGNACKSYGAMAIMRVPGRLRITWQDNSTLKIETDAGQQTRLIHLVQDLEDLRPPLTEPRSWQGYSVGMWEVAGGRGRGGAAAGVGAGAAAVAPAGGGRQGPPPAARGGDLKVETTNVKTGYYRKNGPPYSENAWMTEYFDRHREPNGDEWLTVTTIVHDPQYLQTDFITSTHFKREADASKWNPKPCVAK
jgi:hypothetical protein